MRYCCCLVIASVLCLVSLECGLWHILSSVCKVTFVPEDSGIELEIMLRLDVGIGWLMMSCTDEECEE